MSPSFPRVHWKGIAPLLGHHICSKIINTQHAEAGSITPHTSDDHDGVRLFARYGIHGGDLARTKRPKHGTGGRVPLPLNRDWKLSLQKLKTKSRGSWIAL